jgi:nucleoside-diphosphate-sugar epimerase
LISGSAGFVAGGLAKYLRVFGHEIAKFDIKDGWSDITDLKKVEQVFDQFKPEQVYHLAAQAFVQSGEDDPDRDLIINGIGTLNILRCALKHNSKVVVASSSAADNPTSNYGCSKRLAELYTIKWAKMNGLDAKVVRYSSVYGAGRGREGPVNAFLERAKEGKSLTVYGDGSLSRDFTYICDACRGTESVMEYGKPGEIYNVGSGYHRTVMDVAKIVHDITKAPIIFEKEKLSKFDTPVTPFGIELLSKMGYISSYDLEDGILKTWEEMNG